MSQDYIVSLKIYIPWIKSSIDSNLPKNAVPAANKGNGATIFIGRTRLDGNVLPCYINPQKKEARTAYNGKVLLVREFEVLAGEKVKWVPEQDGDAPGGSIVGGKTADGEDLFIGRTTVDDTTIVGTIWPSKKALFVAHEDTEKVFTNYEALVLHRVCVCCEIS